MEGVYFCEVFWKLKVPVAAFFLFYKAQAELEIYFLEEQKKF